MANIPYHDSPPPCVHDFALESTDERGVKFSKCRHCPVVMIDSPVEVATTAKDGHAPVGDARAQLWARVYAAEFESLRRRPEPYPEEASRKLARVQADAAVRDFDEHYLGRAPSSKG